jgi:hypothetical protein
VSAVTAVAAVAALEDRDAAGRGVRIEFLRLQDRYAHRILAVGCEEMPVLLLESVEGTAVDQWPPSPAFQALNLEDLQDEESESLSAMLVGTSGSTHWSMSVKSLTASDSHGPSSRESGFYFDAAARLKSVPKVLSTRYLIGKRVRAHHSAAGILLHFGSGQAQLDWHTTESAVDSNGWQLDQRGNELWLEFAPNLSQTKLPTTIRAGYSVRLLVN